MKSVGCCEWTAYRFFHSNTPLELERLSDEAKQSSDIIIPVSESENLETEIDKKVN